MAPIKKTGDSVLSLPITQCKGVGPKTSVLLQRLGITTVGQLLYHFPRAYLDRRTIIPIASVLPSHPAVVQGEVVSVRCFRPSRRLHITQCVLKDESGSMKAIWFNQPYMRKNLPVGAAAILSGNTSIRDGLQMENPDMEVISGEGQDFLHTKNLVPVYPLTGGLGQKKLRRLIRASLDDFLDAVPENLTPSLIEANRLLPRKEALRRIHFPSTNEESARARERVAFEEFLALQLHIQSASVSDLGGIAHNSPAKLTPLLRSRLRFSLTSAQEKAIKEIFHRMESPRKMNVLLQGDVGSGKTIVAACAMLKAVENGKQAILMAPTEVLADQHFSSFNSLIGGVGVKIVCLSASRSAREKQAALALMRSGEPSVIIGTHALIEDRVSIPNASLVIIDEQHRFGVNQRAALGEKGLYADLIVMTATPIPRTLALTLYGSFHNILIDEYPPGRHPVETTHVREPGRGAMLEFLREQIAGGRQAFVVCPEIDGGDDSTEPAAASVAKAYAEYAKIFPKYRIRVLHGRMPPEDRERTLLQFRDQGIHILIATTIIEVGVDVPNASVMIVESADRFGLAQLHQLRGRVGRSHHKSYCFLVAEPSTPEAIRRIEIMTSTSDGFSIAEHDMLLRGPGEFLGIAQSGLPPLRVGHLIRDASLLEHAREAARAVLEADPRLDSAENSPLRSLAGAPHTVHL